jgi:hypothetical protein
MHTTKISHHRPRTAPPPRRRTRPWLWLAAASLAGCLTAACAPAASTSGTAAPAVQWHSSVITGYHAGPGWDPATGWGSPDAQYLVPLLARAARSGA